MSWQLTGIGASWVLLHMALLLSEGRSPLGIAQLGIIRYSLKLNIHTFIQFYSIYF